MESVYKRLAKVLDRIPNGYPKTKSGVELKILQKLFNSQEAQLACYLTLESKTAKGVARDIGWEERETFVLLKGMTKKGLIEADRGEGGLAFKLMPFIVGFYERQNAQIDEEFASLFEIYYKEAFYKMMTLKPSIHRVIPVESTIPLNVEVMPYERASHYLNNAQAWGVLPCICRTQKELIGEGCPYSKENCLVFSSRPGAFDRTDAIRTITLKEAFEILSKAHEEGLVHSTGNKQEGLDYICNCCSCCCGVMRGVAEYGELNAVGRSEFYAEIDQNSCTGCEECILRCQFKALNMDSSINVCQVNLTKCYGCGLCISACSTEAISLKQKSAEQIEPPPKNESHWRAERTKTRKEE